MTTAATCAFGEVSRSPSYYRGEQFDSDLGLYYLRARYYNPASGRFLSRDPEDHSPFNPNELHKYLYANGDPVNRMDPRGRGTIESLFTITVISTPTEVALVSLTVGGAAWAATAVEVTAEIAADLAEAAAEEAAGQLEAAWGEIVTSVNEFNALVRESSAIGALTRALACGDLALLAAQIVEHWGYDRAGHIIEWGGTVGCATLLDVRVLHH